MLKIGEFSALARVSVKALRYYDEMGLLRPVRIDPESGYRYYSAGQLPRLHRALVLKDLGFPLDRITQALDEGISVDALRGMLMLRQAEQEERLRQESERLGRLKALLRLIEEEGMRAGEVVVKDLPAQRMVSVRDVIPRHRDIQTLFERLFRALGSTAAQGQVVAIWHDAEYRERGLDAEAGICVKDSAEVSLTVESRELPAATVASVVHQGAFNRIGEACAVMLRWIDANEFRQTGPLRTLFLRVAEPASPDHQFNVTEIQLPVERASK